VGGEREGTKLSDLKSEYSQLSTDELVTIVYMNSHLHTKLEIESAKFVLDERASGNQSDPPTASEDLEELTEKMSQLDDKELIRLIAIDSLLYRKDAVDVARTILQHRHRPLMTSEEYYQEFPLERILPSGFCVACYLQTKDESPGDTWQVNFCGTRLIGYEQCPICHSIIQIKWFCLLIPIIPLGKYRVIYSEKSIFNSSYIGRKFRVKEPGDRVLAQSWNKAEGSALDTGQIVRH
jgi:hypothetical protein